MDEDSIGWKLCHGDVFRPPKYTLLLAPLLGSGVQCLVMVAGTIGKSILWSHCFILLLTCYQCFPLLVCSTHHLGEDLFLTALHSMFWQGKMTCALDDLDHD